MKDRSGGVQKGRPQRRLVGPEGDRVDLAALRSDQGTAHMPLAHRLGVTDANAGENKTRRRVAGAERADPPIMPTNSWSLQLAKAASMPSSRTGGAAPGCGPMRSSRSGRVQRRLARHRETCHHGIPRIHQQPDLAGCDSPHRGHAATERPGSRVAVETDHEGRPAVRFRPGGWRRCRSRHVPAVAFDHQRRQSRDPARGALDPGRLVGTSRLMERRSREFRQTEASAPL